MATISLKSTHSKLGNIWAFTVMLVIESPFFNMASNIPNFGGLGANRWWLGFGGLCGQVGPATGLLTSDQIMSDLVRWGRRAGSDLT